MPETVEKKHESEDRGEFMVKSEVRDLFRYKTTRAVELAMARGLPHYKVHARRTLFRRPEVLKWLESNCRVVRSR